MSNTNKTNTESKKTQPTKKDLEIENKELKQKLQELEELEKSRQNTEVKITEEDKNVYKDQEIKKNIVIKPIDENTYIYIQSKTNKINLKGSRGEIITLEGIGDRRPVRMVELREIIRSNKRFYEKGYFIVEDDDAIRELNLDRIKKKESVDDIETFLTKEIKDFTASYQNIDFASRQSIRSLLIEKIIDGQDVDLNQVVIVDKEYKKDKLYALSIEEEAGIFLQKKN